MDKLTLKFIWKLQGLKTAKTILNKKSRVGGFTFSNFKTCYKVIVTKIVWNWHRLDI